MSRAPILLLATVLPTVAVAEPFTLRASLAGDGRELAAPSDDPAISADGSTVAFVTGDQDVIPGANGDLQVYVTPRRGNRLERVSSGPDGRPGDRGSISPVLSADGRFVAFESVARNLVPNDANFEADVFLADRLAGTLVAVSADADGATAPGRSAAPAISADGRVVAFESNAPGLAPGDSDALRDVLVFDRDMGDFERASAAVGGGPANGASQGADLSADGRFVAFTSAASNLVGDDTDSRPDAFVRDRVAGATVRVNTTVAGGQGGASVSVVAIADDGARAAFFGIGGGLVPGVSGTDIYVKTLATGAIEALGIVTLSGGAPRVRVDTLDIDADGCRIAFDLVPLSSDNTAIGPPRAWVHDCVSGEFSAVGAVAGTAPRVSSEPALDATGRNVVYLTPEAGIVTGGPSASDGNSVADVLLSDAGEGCDTTSADLSRAVARREWIMLSLPCEPLPGEDTVGGVFADELGDRVRTDWTVFTFDERANRYAEAGLDTPLVPGEGFWLIQAIADEMTLRLPPGANRLPRDTASLDCASPAGCTDRTLSGALSPTRWNFEGNPFDVPVTVGDVRVGAPSRPCSRAGGCTLAAAADPTGAALVHDTFFRWNAALDDYDELQGAGALRPWDGVWIAELTNAVGNPPVLHVPYAPR